MAQVRRSLSLYAEHAGLSKEGARKWLIRIGIDYLNPFDFKEADRLIQEARHADREPFTKAVYGSLADDEPVDEATKKDPRFIESQARREMFRAKLTELEYLERVSKLIPAEEVDLEWLELSRQVRDTMLTIPARIAGQLAHETDQRKVQDLLEAEIYQALESIAAHEEPAT
jgi:phage terminase Nu1 subunit (DNA packaging protein)